MAGAPPQALGPRPGSRSLAADTVCFPGDAHPPTRHRPFLLVPPAPGACPGVQGARLHRIPAEAEMTRWKVSLAFTYLWT